MIKKIERVAKRLFLRFISLLKGVEKVSPDEMDSALIGKVLVIRQHDQLGDMLLSVPAIRGIAANELKPALIHSFLVHRGSV